MNMVEETGTLTQEDVYTNDLLTLMYNYNLVVWNDNKNSFEWVIETLIDICAHTHEQAEQCAYIIHFQGKYAVKQGNYDTLKPMREAITERGINATIEEAVKS